MTYFITRDIFIIIYLFYYLKKLNKMNGQTRIIEVKKKKKCTYGTKGAVVFLNGTG
jgi:hypothetical protein